MPSLPKEIACFMEKYGVESDEIWQVHGSAWVVKHKALERIAAEKKITFERPAVLAIDQKEKTIALVVFGKMGDREEWSTGEAAPYNNKNGYPVAMAEKRAKDRVILKLLQAHGDLYSEDEADDFKNKDDNGRPAILPKKDAKGIYTKLQTEIDEAVSREQLKEWGEANADRIAVMPEDWQDILRLRFGEKLAELRQREAA
jgi:hypothetical protein